MSNSDPIIQLEDALALVFDTQALTIMALRSNLKKEDERRLNKFLARLVVEEADLISMIDALEDGGQPGIAPPTAAQVADISTLSGEVEQLTNGNLAASGVLAVSGKVLDLAIAVSGA